MTQAQTVTKHITIPTIAATVVTVFAIWVSVALAAGTPGSVSIASTTHPSQSAWYPSASPSFAWSAAQDPGGTIAGYSFVLDQNANTAPPVTTGTASLSYLPKLTYNVGSGPAEDRVADLSNNGIEDIVVENASSSTVSVLMGNGDGTFKPAVNYATDANPWSMDIGDVNGDGKLDIVTCNEAANTVSVLLGNGDGSFRPAVNYTTGAGTSPECMRLGDLTADGKLDIVTANAGTNNISVLLNNGNGTFRAPTTFSTPTHPTSIAIGDLNDDGKQDLVTANYVTNNVSVLLGNGNGSFQSAVNYDCGTQPETVVLADLNDDGHLDIATADYTNTASVLLNNGNGTFATHVDYVTGSGPYSLEAADLNHDGAIDLVTVNHAANSVSVLLGKGDGTFMPHVDYATGNGPFWVALGDFNHDGYGDIAVTNETDSTVSVLLGSAYFTSKLAASFSGEPDGVWYMHVRAVDTLGVGGPTSTYTVHIDTTASVTTASGLVTTANSGWTNAPTVTLSATDALSGVKATFYTIDGGSQQTYSGGCNVAGTGSHTVSYWSVDNAGNVETTHSGYVNIDTTAPVTTAATDPSGWTNGSVEVTLSASDTGGAGLDTTSYQIGDGAVQTYTAPFTVGDATPVSYWSTDNAGNTETAGTLTPKIDTTAPVTTAAGFAADDHSDWQPGPATVALEATDASSGIAVTTYYEIDSQGMQPYSGPFQVPGEGSHTVTYYSVDALGNAEKEQIGFVNIDSLPPTSSATGLQAEASGGWQKETQTVTLQATDSGSGVAAICYSVNGIAQPDCTAPFSFLISGEGSHVVSYYAVDAAGNAETPAHVGYVNIDTTPPATVASGLAANDQSNYIHDTQQVTLTASDAGCGVETTYYTVDGAGPTAYTGPFVVAGVGTHTVAYYSVDKLGNAEDTRTGYVNIVPEQALVVMATGLAGNDHSDWLTVPASVTLTPSGGGGGIITEYCIDNGSWQTYTVPFVVGGSGSHLVVYRSSDNVGDPEVQGSGYVNIDMTAPVAVASGPTTPQRTSAVVHLSASDAQSGADETFYCIDKRPWQTGTTAIVAAPANHKMDGLHTISYYSVDVAGNTGAVKQFPVRIDTTRPVLTLHVAKRVTVRKGHVLNLRYRVRDASACKLLVTFSHRVHKRVSKSSYALSARRVSSWQTSKLRLTLPRGTYTVQLRLRDAAGNLSPVKGIRVTVK